MSTAQDESRMLRKQYHLSPRHVRRIEALRAELGLDSDAALIRRAIDTFDPDALDMPERELVEATARDLLKRIKDLNANIEETLEHIDASRRKRNDPAWIESIRQRTRREAENDPALVSGIAQLIGA